MSDEKYICVQLISNSKELVYLKKDLVELEENDLLIKVLYSSYNYKDRLVFDGRERTPRKYPHTLGIDAAGVVVESKKNNFKAGQLVAVLATQMGISIPGGFAGYVSVPAKKVIKISKDFSARDLMLFGTAGLTAALAVSKLIDNPNICVKHPVLITGASGGVGIISAILLNSMGYEICVSTNNQLAKDFFKKIGVTSFIDRLEKGGGQRFSLLPERWSSCIDIVGGVALDLISKSIVQSGSVLSIGSMSNQFVELNLAPFNLRGISLVGINTEALETDEREELLEKFLSLEILSKVNYVSSEHNLKSVPQMFVDGFFKHSFGRHIIKIN